MTTWTKQKLGEAVTFRTGKLNSNAAVVNGKYPFFTCSQEIYKTNTFSFDTECVLLGGNNASAVIQFFILRVSLMLISGRILLNLKMKTILDFYITHSEKNSLNCKNSPQVQLQNF